MGKGVLRGWLIYCFFSGKTIFVKLVFPEPITIAVPEIFAHRKSLFKISTAAQYFLFTYSATGGVHKRTLKKLLYKTFSMFYVVLFMFKRLN